MMTLDNIVLNIQHFIGFHAQNLGLVFSLAASRPIAEAFFIAHFRDHLHKNVTIEYLKT
jgi:hypothetical protein